MDTKYGFSMSDWKSMVEEIRLLLVDVAKNEELISYTDLVAKIKTARLDPHSYALANLLGDVSTAEFKANRPLLSSLVVYKGTSEPGPGFFSIAKELGISIKDEIEFHLNEVKKCFKYWR